MTGEELMKLRNSNEAPYDHADFSVWLHNQIVDKVQFELWNFREKESGNIKSSYAACNHIISLPSLQRIK